MFKFILLLITIAVVACSTSKSVSASLKDTSVQGLEGVNLNVNFPFKFNEYVVGIKHAFGNHNNAPDTLYVKRDIKTGDDGVAHIEADYNTHDNVLSVASKWESDQHKLKVSVDANSRDKVTDVGLKASRGVNGNTVGVNVDYNVHGHNAAFEGSVSRDETVVKVSYDTAHGTPQVAVSQKLNKNNEINPKINLKTGAITYGWTRKYNGGSIESTLDPSHKSVAVNWEDHGSNGNWKTSANIPLEDLKGSKVTVSRAWDI